MTHASPELPPTYDTDADTAPAGALPGEASVPGPPLPGEVDSRPGILQMRESLTGFDDIAIQRYFGKVQDLGPNMHTRTLGFVQLRRLGDDDANAHMKIMAMTIGAVEEMFRDDIEDAEGNR